MSDFAHILQPVAILGTLSYGICIVTKAFTDYFLQKKMIDKGLVGADASELLKVQKSELLKVQKEDNKYGALKWGIIILFGGIGLILLEVIPYPVDSPLPYGVVATSLSLGFLVYFLLVRKMKDPE